MMPRSENRELPVLYLLLLAVVLIFIFNLSTGKEQQQDYTGSSAIIHAQALVTAVPQISNQPVPVTFTLTGHAIKNPGQDGCEQNLQRITRVMWLQARTDNFKRLPPLHQHFYYHYFSGGKTDIPAFC
jgi:hypothetical protein